MAPIIGRREAESEGDNARTVRGFRAAYVFDVDQTDGEPLPTPIEASGDPGRIALNILTRISDLVGVLSLAEQASRLDFPGF